jgi:hypothetical protein
MSNLETVPPCSLVRNDTGVGHGGSADTVPSGKLKGGGCSVAIQVGNCR